MDIEEIDAIRRQHRGDHLAQPCWLRIHGPHRAHKSTCDIQTLLGAIDTLRALLNAERGDAVAHEPTDC